MKYDICVFGGCALDSFFYKNEAGEVPESPSLVLPGGKGANQAVAAARAATAALTAFCLYPLAILPAYSFRAAGDTRYATVSSTVITILCQVGLCFLFVKCFHMGIVGVWLGMGGDWLARAIVHSIHFSRNKWLTKKVI